MSGTMTGPGATRAGVRKWWSIAEFDRLLAGGFLREGGRTFLWDGEIIEAMSENPPHVNAVANLVDLLRGRFPSARWTVSQGAPIVLAEGYKPQPDITVIRGARSAFRGRTPAASDVVLLVEVADGAYSEDASAFLRAYAAAGIPRYWIVNIAGRRIEAYSSPNGVAGYRDRRDYGCGATVPLPDLAADGPMPGVEVSDVLLDSLDSPGDGA